MQIETFDISLQIAAPVDAVLSVFWDVTRWPEVAPHVNEASLIYCDEDVQIIMMQVTTYGRTDRFKTVRVRQGERIHFIQPNPPKIFYFHTGIWHFTKNSSTGSESSIVRVVHSMQTNVEVARKFLSTQVSEWHEANTEEGIRASMQAIISQNSLQTMRGLKDLVEREHLHAEASAL